MRLWHCGTNAWKLKHMKRLVQCKKNEQTWAGKKINVSLMPVKCKQSNNLTLILQEKLGTESSPETVCPLGEGSAANIWKSLRSSLLRITVIKYNPHVIFNQGQCINNTIKLTSKEHKISSTMKRITFWWYNL